MTKFAGNYQGPLYAPHPDLKIMNRSELQDKFIHADIDAMDLDDMYTILYDLLEEKVSKLSDEELMEDVKEYHSHLLEPTVNELEETASDYGVGK